MRTLYRMFARNQYGFSVKQLPLKGKRNPNGYVERRGKAGQLNVAGWNATNQAIGKDYHYVILYDQTANHEVSRQLVKDNNQRPDVAMAYPQVINADKSGFY